MRRRTALKSLLGSATAGLAAVDSATATTVPPSVRPTEHSVQESYAPIGSVGIPNATECIVAPGGETAFVARFDGFSVVDLSDPADPTVVATRTGLLSDFEDGPLGAITDLFLDGSELLVGGPYETGHGNPMPGLALFDVSDPANPERMAAHETDTIHHNLKYRDGVAYYARAHFPSNTESVDELVMADVTGENLVELGTWSLLEADENWTSVPPLIRGLHDLWVHDGVAYLAYWDAGTFVVDVSDPASPALLARIGGRSIDELAAVRDAGDHLRWPPGNHHFVTVNDDATLLGVGKESEDDPTAEESGPSGVTLWDVSDLEAPAERATVDPPAANPRVTYNVTAHNFDIHGDRLFTSWYNAGVRVHDVSDPATPTEVAAWRAPEETSFWTAQYANDEAFVATSTSLHRQTRGALYTFPNEAGTQAAPPPLAEPDTPTPTVTPSPTATPTRTPSPTPPVSTAPPQETPTETATTAPGFGLLGGLAGLGLTAWRRRQRE